MSNNLKLCPFCGSCQAKLFEQPYDKVLYAVRCEFCHIVIEGYPSAEAAIKKWNTRGGVSEQPVELPWVSSADKSAPVRYVLVLYSDLKPEQGVRLCFYSIPDAEWLYVDTNGEVKEFVAYTRWCHPITGNAIDTLPKRESHNSIESALKNAAEILANFKSNEPYSNATEAERLERKLEEWQACYAKLFTQMTQIVEASQKREISKEDWCSLFRIREHISFAWARLGDSQAREHCEKAMHEVAFLMERHETKRNDIEGDK